jgi:hypothetical protein
MYNLGILWIGFIKWIDYNIIGYICDYGPCVTTFKDLFTIIAIIVGGLWALNKYIKYRENKHWIQFEIDANILKLEKNVKPWTYSSSENVRCHERQMGNYCHAVELLFKFTNKGNTRVKIYNIRGKISTMPPLGNDAEICQEDGHLSLCAIFKSGNIVPKGKTLLLYRTTCGTDHYVSYSNPEAKRITQSDGRVHTC